METRSPKKKVSKTLLSKEQPKYSSYHRCGKKEKQMLDFFFFFPTAEGGEI